MASSRSSTILLVLFFLYPYQLDHIFIAHCKLCHTLDTLDKIDTLDTIDTLNTLDALDKLSLL